MLIKLDSFNKPSRKIIFMNTVGIWKIEKFVGTRKEDDPKSQFTPSFFIIDKY